jgi:hypothetical protein
MKGGLPVAISYTRIPNVHQSTANPWPFISKISGARYSAVPQKECVRSVLPYKNFERPKSAKYM